MLIDLISATAVADAAAEVFYAAALADASVAAAAFAATAA